MIVSDPDPDPTYQFITEPDPYPTFQVMSDADADLFPDIYKVSDPS